MISALTNDDSGIQWIGDIPKNWAISPMKRLCSIGTGDKDKIDSEPDGQYPFFVRSPEVQRISTYSYDGEAVLTAGDGDVGKIFHYVNGKYDCHQRVYNLTNFNQVMGRYLYYYLSVNFINIVEMGTAKSTVSSLRMPMLEEFPVIYPSIGMQAKIVEYLDSICDHIDSISALSREKIGKLEELRQSIITETVTKGLNSDTEMKDSGIEWIGRIPRDWKVTRVKFSCNLKGRIGWQGLKSDEFTDEGPFVITGVDFNEGSIDWKNCNHFSMERFNEDPNIHVFEDDLLITKDGTIGKVALATNCPEFVSLNSGVMIIRPLIELNRRYLYYVLTSNVFWLWYESNQRGNSTIRHLYQEQFNNFKFPLPPASEQDKIVTYLTEKCSCIDEQILLENRKMALIDEYKRSLVYELVTGKKEMSQ